MLLTNKLCSRERDLSFLHCCLWLRRQKEKDRRFVKGTQIPRKTQCICVHNSSVMSLWWFVSHGIWSYWSHRSIGTNVAEWKKVHQIFSRTNDVTWCRPWAMWLKQLLTWTAGDSDMWHGIRLYTITSTRITCAFTIYVDHKICQRAYEGHLCICADKHITSRHPMSDRYITGICCLTPESSRFDHTGRHWEPVHIKPECSRSHSVCPLHNPIPGTCQSVYFGTGETFISGHVRIWIREQFRRDLLPTAWKTKNSQERRANVNRNKMMSVYWSVVIISLIMGSDLITTGYFEGEG